MMEHVWTVVCSRVIIDERSDNVSIINALQRLTVRREPVPNASLPIRVELVTLWARKDPDVPSEGRARYRLLMPSGAMHGNALEITEDLTQNETTRSVIHFQGFPLHEAGRHTFIVDLQVEGENEWRQVAAVPVTLAFESPEEEAVAEEKE